MVKERNYLIETLKSSGIKSQVYTNMKKLKAGNEVHVGAVLRNGETFARSGSKKTYIDQEGQRKRRVKLWDRSTSLHVVIADTSEEKVEEILENFLRNLKKGIDVDGNWVNIVVGEEDWVEEGDSILKAKVAVQFDITFEGGIYQDRDIKPMDIGSVLFADQKRNIQLKPFFFSSPLFDLTLLPVYIMTVIKVKLRGRVKSFSFGEQNSSLI